MNYNAINSFCNDSGNVFQPFTIFCIAGFISISCRKNPKTDHVHFSFSNDIENTRDSFKIIHNVFFVERYETFSCFF